MEIIIILVLILFVIGVMLTYTFIKCLRLEVLSKIDFFGYILTISTIIWFIYLYINLLIKIIS